MKDRAFGYAGVASKHNSVSKQSLTSIIEAAVQKAVAKAMDQLLANLGDSIAQAISEKNEYRHANCWSVLCNIFEY